MLLLSLHKELYVSVGLCVQTNDQRGRLAVWCDFSHCIFFLTQFPHHLLFPKSIVHFPASHKSFETEHMAFSPKTMRLPSQLSKSNSHLFPHPHVFSRPQEEINQSTDTVETNTGKSIMICYHCFLSILHVKMWGFEIISSCEDQSCFSTLFLLSNS